MEARYTVEMKRKDVDPDAEYQFIYWYYDNDSIAYGWIYNTTDADDRDVAFFTEKQVMDIVAGTLEIKGTTGTHLNDYLYKIHQWEPSELNPLVIDTMLQEALYENAIAKLTEAEIDILRRKLR